MRTVTEDMIDLVYDSLEGCEDLARYHDEHGTPSLLVLTQHNPKIAARSARLLDSDIKNKVVIEIGAGVGFLAIEMARSAKFVYAIEVDPAWSWVFTSSLYRHKPPNLTWIFGSAESVEDKIKGDIAVIFTNSGIEAMRRSAYRMAPRVIMPLQEWPKEKTLSVVERLYGDALRELVQHPEFLHGANQSA